MKGGVWRSDFFLNYWDWLRGCANWCLEEICPVEVLLLQQWRKKLCSSSPHVRCPGEAFLDQVGIWNLYPSQKIYIKCWNRNILEPGRSLVSLNHTSNITHSAIASQDSSWVTTTFSTHCTLRCAACKRFQRTILRITMQSRYDTVPYCARDITCKIKSATS